MLAFLITWLILMLQPIAIRDLVTKTQVIMGDDHLG